MSLSGRVCTECYLQEPDTIIDSCPDDALCCIPCKRKRWPLRSQLNTAPVVSNISTQLNVVGAKNNRSSASGGVATAGKSTDSTIMNGDIITNELLCFVSNKLEVMPYDTIVKVCTDFYPEQAVTSAKNTLYEVLGDSTGKRCVTRKGNNKKNSELQDILNVLIEIKICDMPVFVTRDLGNLPPLSFDHFDITKVMRDIEVIRNELYVVKESVFISGNSSLECKNCSLNDNRKKMCSSTPKEGCSIITDEQKVKSPSKQVKSKLNSEIKAGKTSDTLKSVLVESTGF